MINNKPEKYLPHVEEKNYVNIGIQIIVFQIIQIIEQRFNTSAKWKWTLARDNLDRDIQAEHQPCLNR